MIDSVLALLALAGLGGFLAVIGVFVPHTSLIIVMALAFLCAAYDFLRERTKKR